MCYKYRMYLPRDNVGVLPQTKDDSVNIIQEMPIANPGWSSR